MATHFLFIAAGWADFLRLLPFVIAFLVWVIGRFATQLPQKMPPRGAAPPKPAVPQPKQAGDPLQSEINEFLRQAQAAREGRAATKPGTPPTDRPGEGSRKRSTRRQTAAQSDRGSRRDESRQGTRPSLPPVSAEVSRAQHEAQPPRESVAQHVADTLDSSKFAKRATQLSQVEQSTDKEFREHMQRVFQHDLGTLKKAPTGIFEAAGAAASAESAAVSAKATAAAAGAQSGTAPVATHKRTSDIALFLAGRKNIRDAIILSEILQRPEHRW